MRVAILMLAWVCVALLLGVVVSASASAQRNPHLYRMHPRITQYGLLVHHR